MTSSRQQPTELHFGPAILAWLWPGLGHFSLGRPKRGGLIMFGVLFLVVSGVLIGGIDCVDRREDKLWFLAQGLCGPIAFGVDYVNQNLIKPQPEEQRLLTRSLGHVNEMGTLFVALAGLMNLVVILDALVDSPHLREAERSARCPKEHRPKP
ncbi:MAG: hypothetical protein JSV91_13095 [Phycisphaerales bacterium]|nr:MAG: hypothetical protein JSV91_13095 [Phycisphaerales bacterium]